VYVLLHFQSTSPLTTTDHEQAPYIIHKYLQDGILPPPDSSLMNDKRSDSFDIAPGNKYLFRLINMAAIMAHTISFGKRDESQPKTTY
jgi:iron transport multicopper oxidase